MSNVLSPQVMGILNITPDSFYAASRVTVADIVQKAEEMILAGATWLDIGAESTRPGAQPVSCQQELDRIMPVLEKLQDLPVKLSVDTQKTEVMAAVLQHCHTVQLINDINALQAEAAVATVADKAVSVCLMHKKGNPSDMQDKPYYIDVVTEITDFFHQRVAACEQAGIERSRIILDPGIGFGKTTQHNLLILKNMSKFKALGYSLLIGVSRKKFIGEILQAQEEDRLYGSIAVAVLAAMNGADIVRVHDVKPTIEALKIITAVAGC